MNRLVSYGAAAMTVVLLGAASPVWSEAAPKGDSANGRKVYLADGCWQCHGRVGQGGLMTGAAPVLAQTKLPFAAFARQVRTPVNDMPPYPAALLPDKDLADIFAFLQALPGRRPVKDFPMLND
ncbi:MAG: cytochrome c [Alphaproteobacteria bacterium]|nr:cytochrome c [Alphaproteobacteria bacterium]